VERLRLSRRQLLAAGATAGLAAGIRNRAVTLAAARRETLAFGALGSGDGWPNWACPGVANLRRAGGEGLLEAGSDVFPCDPRPVAFAIDHRFRDGEIEAVVLRPGAGAGVVLRRSGPRSYYAAIWDTEQGALVLVRRSPEGIKEMARAIAPPALGTMRLSLEAHDASPTELVAKLSGGPGGPIEIAAADSTGDLQRAGDPGVLATARTLFPSAGPPVLPALGNVHLLPYGVQEGQAVIGSPLGQPVLGLIRERSTVAFAELAITARDAPGPTPASVIAATAGRPSRRGAVLRVASDLPARVEFEISADPRFRHPRRIRPRPTNSLHGASAVVERLAPGRQVYWRARLRRRGRVTLGPVRSFRALPDAGSRAPVRIAIGACASQFGPIFDRLAETSPDAFIWQGDLNYPDTIGPLAQTISGYAGIWRDFLANPRMRPIFDRSIFVPQRDDHDYGVQDANSTNLVPWGLAPWEGLMESRLYHRFSAGLVEVWVLDQRRHKSDPRAPDTPAKTLLGLAQRRWLMRSLAASRAPVKLICSPCTLAPLPANGRDGSWADGFTAERNLLLEHIRRNVSGRTLFVTGDTHWTLVYDQDGLFEARPCPLGIPTPNDITLTDPQVAEDARSVPGVAYADDDRGHFALVEVSGSAGSARLDLSLVREDGAVPFRRRFDEPLR
jgi:hypothetical protein